jgi:hypothetical protein
MPAAASTAAIATTTTTAATAAAKAATAAATAFARYHRAGFIHSQRASFKILAIKSLDGLGALLFRHHFDKHDQ